jgi:hypothetical protein
MLWMLWVAGMRHGSNDARRYQNDLDPASRGGRPPPPTVRQPPGERIFAMKSSERSG